MYIFNSKTIKKKFCNFKRFLHQNKKLWYLGCSNFIIASTYFSKDVCLNTIQLPSGVGNTAPPIQFKA